MKKLKTILFDKEIFWVLFLGFSIYALFVSSSINAANDSENSVVSVEHQFKVSNSEIPFMKNIGQVDNQIKYFANIFDGSFYVDKNGELVYSFYSRLNQKRYTKFVFKEKFLDNNKGNLIEGEYYKTTINDFRSSDKTKWKKNIPSYRSIKYENLYEGIDLELRAYNKNVEKIFTVSPGYDPEKIALQVEGAENISIDEKGKLKLSTADVSVSLSKPIAYQIIDGNRVTVGANYKVKENTYGFKLDDYNTKYALIIDPLIASTFLGGALTDLPYGPFIEVDDDGYVYISGFSASRDFPRTTGVFQSNYGGGPQDCFIAKFNNDLSELVASTFLGGSGFETECTIELDPEGNVYVGGFTNSTDFPTTPNAFSETNSGAYDIFIAKLSNDLSTLLASTYIGGSKNDGFESNRIDLEVGQNGSLYVAAQSSSEDFPVTEGAYDTTFNGTGVYIYSGDIVAFKFDLDLENLLASTFLGGEIDEYRVSLALDSDDNVFVVTSTYSYNIATPSGAYDKTYNGAAELYIYKLNSDLSTRSNSTYFGGAVDEVPHSAETDSDGNLYITGYTSSTNFTTTADVFDKTFGGVEDGFIIKFDNNLNNLLASTFLGGSKSDRSQAIKIKDGKIYVTGRTLSSDFPIVTGSYDDEFSGGLEHGDISVSVMDLDLTTMYASTYLGGPADEKSLGLAVDNDDNVFIGGFSHSSGYPTTIDAYDQSFGGVIDVIVAKFNFDNVLGVNQENSTPKEFILLQNYPNPFNPTTTIEYQLKEESNVVLTIYNVLGNEVRTIVYERQSIGTKKVIWDGKDNFGKSVSSGVYYYRIKAGDFIQAKKMSLIK